MVALYNFDELATGSGDLVDPEARQGVATWSPHWPARCEQHVPESEPGYFMVGAEGHVYGLGDARSLPVPFGLMVNL